MRCSTISSSVIRERFKVKRQVRVLTAHGRITGWILCGVCRPCLAAAMFVISPGQMRILTEDTLGVQMIIVGLSPAGDRHVHHS